MFASLSPFLDALFPPSCPMCDALHTPTPAAPVCPACAAATQWLGHPLVTGHVPAPAWGSVRAVCRFDGPVVEAVHRLKYGRRPDLAPGLGRLLADLAVATAPHDAVIPVPLSAVRLRRRGYNQSHLLARAIARTHRAPLWHGAVRRVRETPPQVGLNAADRRANVHGAFAVAPRWRARFAGRRVLLVDDVMTTGATLDACARVLRRAGARVHALVLAAA